MGKKRGVCLCCGNVDDLTKDHIVPKRTLNIHGVKSTSINFQPLCADCNSRKGHRLIIDYRPQRTKHLALLKWLAQNQLSHIRVTWQPSER